MQQSPQPQAKQAAAPYPGAMAAASSAPGALAIHPGLNDFKLIRRNGSVVAFEPVKISVAMTKAFLAINGGQGAASARIRELVEDLT
ncbi:MAG: hypothetical protein EBX61_00690, partial [Betaproteobacteria bacterium]|nr:hypothetical protein [Betaproteobacteria bacterium]